MPIDNGNSLTLIEEFQSKYMRLFGKRFTDLYVSCECTLEEFFFGCKKEVFFEKVTLLGDERTEKFDVLSKEIEVKPGMGVQTMLTYPGEGHQRYAH